MANLVCRWQIGDMGDVSWRALNVSIRLMQKLEPEAELFVTYQGQLRKTLDGVHYHAQEPLYSHGRFFPSRWNKEAHEVWFENDHILWALPPAWRRFRQRDNATLVWLVDWDYYGNYAEKVGGFRACPGMFGLPPQLEMPAPPIEERGQDQEEQGFIAWQLRQMSPHEIVTHEEVAAYMPNHEILKHTHSKVGLYGVHLPGLNRGWSAGGEKLLDEIERKWL